MTRTCRLVSLAIGVAGCAGPTIADIGEVDQEAIPAAYPTGAGPASVHYGPDGHLVYVYEPNGDTIPDFSRAGYGGGGVPIPTVAVVRTLAPVSGDNLPQLQATVNSVATMALGADGFRGAILLKAGVYPISGPINVNASGIVLRGEGSGPGGTILRRISGNGDAITVVNNPKRSMSEVAGTRHTIVSSYVPVGATWVTLDSIQGLAVGDEIVVGRPQTTAWTDAMGMGTSGTNDWQAGDADLRWDRVISEIVGTRVRFDAPITQAIEASWTSQAGSPAFVFKYSWPSRIQNVGVEDLRADAPGDNVDTLGNTDGNFVTFTFVKNGWVRRCFNDKMRGHVVRTGSSKWVTIEDVTSFHNGDNQHSGASIQIFTGDSSDLVLFHRITASVGGFEFTAGQQQNGPIVFSESQVPSGFAASGPHMQWNMGLLWDALEMDHGISVQLQQRGWGGGNHVAWNCETHKSFAWERPPTVHQWIQGCTAATAIPAPKHGTGPEVLSWGAHLEPGSLYRAQLQERVGAAQALAVLGRPDGTNHFVLTPAPESASAPAGGSARYAITMTTEPDYPGAAVTFGVSGLPAGAAASLDKTSLAGPGAVSLTVTTTPLTPAGTYVLRVTSTGSFIDYSTRAVVPLTRSAYVSLVVSAAAGGSLYEAESLSIADSSGDRSLIETESGASAGKWLLYQASAAGDFLTLTLPSIPAGKYQLAIGFKKNINRGVVQVMVGPAGGALGNLGTPIDLYAPVASFTELPIGSWTIGTTGNKSVRLAVTGKNASSAGDYAAIDYLRLVGQ